MNPHPTGEHAAVEITESSGVRTDWKTLGVVIATVVLGTLGYADLKSTVRELTARQNTTEGRVSRLEDDRITERLERQKLRDDLDHLVEATDRIDHNVQQLQSKGR